MTPVRLWELARELDISCDELRERLAQIGVDAPHNLCVVPGHAVHRMRRPAPVDHGATEDVGVTRRAFHHLAGHRLRIVLVLFVDLLSAPLLLLLPVPLKVVVDSVIGDVPLPGYVDAVTPSWFQASGGRLLWFAALLQVLVVVVTELQLLVSYVLRTETGERITLRFRSELFRHVQRLSTLYHDARGTADSLYRVQYDAPSLQWLTIDGLVPLLTAGITLLFTLVVIARLNLELALVAVLVTPVLYVLTRGFNQRMRPRYKEAKQLESSALHVAQEVLTSLRVVKAFGGEEREYDRFVGRFHETMRTRVALAFSEGAFGLLVNGATAVGLAAVLYVGARQVQSGALTLGELLLVSAYLAQLYAPLKTISKQIAAMQTSVVGAERAFELLDEPADVDERPDAIPLERAAGQITLRDVRFSYGDGREILAGIDLDVPAGSRVGIIGRTGAGKTTLVSLLPRFFDPTGGCIVLDGVDIRDYRLVDLRNQFAIVPQEPVLFSTSIGENIAYAKPDATAAEIEDAARAANAHDFIQALPDGYDTVVGERGMRLSGGERQRVGLARAFLRNSPILILDEPTSSVDAATEGVIIDAMQRLMVDRTTFMIAHRLGTLRDCDTVVEIANGRIVATRPTTRRRSKRRHQLVRAQPRG